MTVADAPQLYWVVGQGWTHLCGAEGRGVLRSPLPVLLECLQWGKQVQRPAARWIESFVLNTHIVSSTNVIFVCNVSVGKKMVCTTSIAPH